jgi:hypothetical protein
MWLRQSTVSVINFGPVLDFADGVTLEVAAGIITSLDHAATGIMLSKNGQTLVVREQGANFVATTYDAHGCFKVSLSAIDIGTLGRLRVIHTEPATYLAVWRDFMVVPQQVWDSLFGTDTLDVAVVEQANIDFGALQKASITAAVPAVDLSGLSTFDPTTDSVVASNMRGTDNAALALTALSTATWTNERAAKLDTLGGAGAITWPFQVTTAGGVPVDDAEVRVSTDSAGVNVVANGMTNASGWVTPAFMLDAGTYFFRTTAAGENAEIHQETVA